MSRALNTPVRSPTLLGMRMSGTLGAKEQSPEVGRPAARRSVRSRHRRTPICLRADALSIVALAPQHESGKLGLDRHVRRLPSQMGPRYELMVVSGHPPRNADIRSICTHVPLEGIIAD